jgi:hypothetical protein
MSVPSAGMSAVVRASVAPRLARGLHVSLGRGRSMPSGLDAFVLTLQGSGEAEIVPDRAQGRRFDDVMGARTRLKASLSLERFSS